MARAKRTARAEARRRYRAEQGVAEDAEPGADEVASHTQAKPAPSAGGPQRISMAAAFRLSFRPLDLAGDLRALPDIAIHSKALWLPLLLTIGSAVAIAVTGGTDLVSTFMFTYFIVSPPIGGVFLAGFLAPRASWLAGTIVGIFSAICYTILGLTARLPVGPPNFQEVFDAAPQQAILAAFVLSPVMGALFGAAAAWYRRFLQLSNPNRGRQPAAPKRSDGRTRAGGSQKAGARR